MIETKDTTVFVEDAPAAMSMGNTYVPDDELDRATMSVSDFLKKPILIESGEWGTADPRGAELFAGGFLPSYRFIDNYLNNEPLWADKLSGFRLISSTAVIRLQVNANPFQSGRLGLRVLPMAERYRGGILGESGYDKMRNVTLATRFQQPHVELDCRDTVCTLSVPYLAPTQYFALNTAGAYDRGNMYLTVMAPLRQGTGSTSDTVSWSLYLSFEDVKLAANIIPQCSSVIPESSKMGKSIGVKECEVVMGGPVEKILDIGLSVSSSLSDIPAVSSVATGATWAMAAMKGIASYYGWSKPTISGAPQVFTNQPFRYSGTADGASPAYPVGISATNSLDIKDSVSYTTEDEMSWAFLRSVPTFTNTIEWSATDVPGTRLASFPLGPNEPITFETGVLQDSTESQIRVVNCGGPVYYFHPLFKLYRGSLKVCIKMAKTTLHSGRLMFVYTPKPGTVATPTLASSAYAYRHVVDIRDGNTIDLSLPFMSEFGYLPIDEAYGTLDIFILNELKAPPSASQVIDLMVWVCGDKDFEYAVPAGANSLMTPVIPQSGKMESTVSGATTLVDSAIGSSKAKIQGTEHAESCIGEVFTSALSLLKRSSRLFNRSNITSSSIQVRPMIASVASFDGTSDLSPTAGGDYYSYLAPMYCFYRGSFRFTCFDQGFDSDFAATLDPYPNTSTSRIVSSPAGILQGSLALVDWTTTASGPAGTALATGLSDKAAFQLPYYNRTKVSCIPYSTSDSFTNYIDEESVPQVALAVANSTSNFTETAYYRDVGEDFQFSVFLGCPPLILKNLTRASGPPPLRRATTAPSMESEVPAP